MDLLIATNSVPLAQADVAPVTGTPQYATNGNPVTNTPATDLPAYEFNALIAEVVGAITGAGLTPDRNNNAQLLAAIKALVAAGGQAAGQCKLQYVDATHIKLVPFNGDDVTVGGTALALGAGVTASNTVVMVNGVAAQTLADSTDYLVSLYNAAGVPTLAFWTTSAYNHAPDTTAGNVGVEVITNGGAPITGHTLVGGVGTTAAGQFSDTDGARLVASWFNRTPKRSRTAFTADRSTASTAFVELNSEIENTVWVWGADGVHFSANGSVYFPSGGAWATGIGFDGGAAEVEACAGGNPTVSVFINPLALAGRKTGVADGRHTATLLGMTGGSAATWLHATGSGAGPGSTMAAACSLILESNG